MRIHPDLAALRRNRAAQRRHLAAMDEAKARWLQSEGVAEIERDFDAYAAGGELSELPALGALVSDHVAARAFVHGFAGHFARWLGDNPLCEVPFRHRSSDGFSRLQLLYRGGAMLSLCSYEPVAETDAPQSVQFIDCEVHEMIVAGEAEGLWHMLDQPEVSALALQTRRVCWRAGDALVMKPMRNMRHVVNVRSSLSVLQLSRTPEHARPSREYGVADAKLIKITSGDRRASEHVMALGVLGALGQERCLPTMIAFAERMQEDADARWEAVRQVLAMHSGEGMRLLGNLAARSGDPLAQPASRLADQLIQQHLQLRMARAG